MNIQLKPERKKLLEPKDPLYRRASLYEKKDRRPSVSIPAHHPEGEDEKLSPLKEGPEIGNALRIHLCTSR